MTPNQEVIVNIETKELHKTVTQKPQILIPLSISKDLIFEENEYRRSDRLVFPFNIETNCE